MKDAWKDTKKDIDSRIDLLAIELGLVPCSQRVNKTMAELNPKGWLYLVNDLGFEKASLERYRRTGRTTKIILRALIDVFDNPDIQPLFVGRYLSVAKEMEYLFKTYARKLLLFYKQPTICGITCFDLLQLVDNDFYKTYFDHTAYGEI